MSKSKMVLQLYASFFLILCGFAFGFVAGINILPSIRSTLRHSYYFKNNLNDHCEFLEFPENLRPSQNILCYTDGHTLAKNLDLRYCSHIVVSLPSNITHHNGSVVLDKGNSITFLPFSYRVRKQKVGGGVASHGWREDRMEDTKVTTIS